MAKVSDTHPKAERFLIEGYRRMKPSDRLAKAFEMTEGLVELAKAGILKRHPGIARDELEKRLGAVLWGRDLSIKVNGWDPDEMGY